MNETDAGETGVTKSEPTGITPSQTVGPFFNIGLTPGDRYGFDAFVGEDLVTADTVGDRIRIEGRVLDGDGEPVPDAMVEIWQANGAGRYSGGGQGPPPNTAFKGFGRSECDGDGRYRFHTVKPGTVPGPDGRPQAPHINVAVFARGILRRLFTRIYFDGEAANAGDAVLALVPADGRDTLIARRDGTVGDTPRYVFDIHLQGEKETVFFQA